MSLHTGDTTCVVPVVDIECVVDDMVPVVDSVPSIVMGRHSSLNVHPAISLHSLSVVVSLHAGGDTSTTVFAPTAATANASKHQERIFHKYAQCRALIQGPEL